MNTRILSPVVVLGITIATISTTTIDCRPVLAGDTPGYYTDPSTGIVYRQVTKMVERPVVETTVETQQKTVFRPQTVTESKPVSRRIYTPSVEYKWEPRLQGRWNPFREPTIAYRHVPKTVWEAEDQVVTRTQTRTEWVAEKRTVDVPKRLVRIEREQKVEYEPIGRVAPPQANPPGPSQAIASRLRPLDANTRIQSLGSSAPTYRSNSISSASSIASVGRMTSDPPRRSSGQGGMRANELVPSSPTGYGQALPPVDNTMGIAKMPGLSLWR